MALKNLKAELDALEKTLRTPKGQGSSANPFRKQMNTHVHTFKFSEAMIKKEPFTNFPYYIRSLIWEKKYLQAIML